MKKRLGLSAVAGIVLLATGAVAAEADVDGVTPGKWTMDLDAAVKHAEQAKQAILLNFSGSDWCGWCKIMEENVFSKKAWRAYAASNCVMVLLDFPSDKSLVPEKYAARNAELQKTYGIKGFPTFILLDDDGRTELGRLGAGQDKTPESFIAEIRALTRYRKAEMEKYLQNLSPELQAEYRAIVAGIWDGEKAIEEQKKRIAAAERKIGELEQEVEKAKEKAMEFRVARLGDEALKEYRDLKEKLAKAAQVQRDWLQTKPERTEENSRKFQSLHAEIEALVSRLSQY